MKTIIILSLLAVLLQGFNLCEACIKTNEAVQNSIITITPTFLAKDVVQSVCERQYESTQLCKKVADQLTPLAITMGVRGVLKTGRMCEWACPAGFYAPLDIDAQIKKIIESKETFENIAVLPYQSEQLKVNRGSTKVLHISDIHLDLNYTAGASTLCDFPICCHEEHGFPNTNSAMAPEYGSTKCDTPTKLFESGLTFIKEKLTDIDAVLISGDLSAHNEWQKTAATVVEVRKHVQQRIKQTTNVSIASAPGNNEYLPDHQVDPTAFPEDSLKVVDLTNDAGKTLSLISMNSLYCDNINLYLIQDQTMPLRQLKTLDSIIASKENVVLVAHISPTSASCSPIYGRLFRAILTKHSSKIKGQFYGHTHLDQFVVNTNPIDNETSTSFGFLVGSFSPLSTNQPRMRVYELTDSFDLLNYNDYAFDMNSLKWGFNYNFKEYYGLPLDQPINGALLQKLQKDMSTDTKLQEKYGAKAKASPQGGKYYCQTYDSPEAVQQCSGADFGFKGKVQDLLNLLQGKWGAYGSSVQ